MTRDEAINLFTIALSNFNSTYVNEMTRETWVQCLKDCSYETGKKNLIKHIETSSFFPKVNDINKPSMSFHDHLKRDTQMFLNSPIVKDSKGEPPPGYVKDYMNKLRSELQNKREKG